MKIKMAGSTDVGRRRTANQDSIYYDARAGIGIVADGIGGRPGGDVASSLLVGGLREVFIGSGTIPESEVGTFLTSQIIDLNRAIIDQGKQSGKFDGMGTTLNCVVFIQGKIFIAHIGDSRTYLFANGHLFQLTIDHNVETFIKRGLIPKNGIHKGVKGSALMRAVGLVDQVEIDIYDKNIFKNEIYLTASDGLFDMISDQSIASIMSKNLKSGLDKTVQALIRQANDAGGRDNITVLLSKVMEA